MLKGIASRLGRRADAGSSHRDLRWPILAAALLAVALLLAVAAQALRAPARAPALSFVVPPPLRGSMGLTNSSVNTAQFAVSPDGHAIVFVASSGGNKNALWLRTLESADPQLLAGTHGASYPFWSPDSRHIGFFADQQLKRIPAAGGAPDPLCGATNGRGGTWNPNGDIVFAPDNYVPLHRVN